VSILASEEIVNDVSLFMEGLGLLQLLDEFIDVGPTRVGITARHNLLLRVVVALEMRMRCHLRSRRRDRDAIDAGACWDRADWRGTAR